MTMTSLLLYLRLITGELHVVMLWKKIWFSDCICAQFLSLIVCLSVCMYVTYRFVWWVLGMLKQKWQQLLVGTAGQAFSNLYFNRTLNLHWCLCLLHLFVVLWQLWKFLGFKKTYSLFDFCHGYLSLCVCAVHLGDWSMVQRTDVPIFFTPTL